MTIDSRTWTGDDPLFWLHLWRHVWRFVWCPFGHKAYYEWHYPGDWECPICNISWGDDQYRGIVGGGWNP